ncbi:MAG: class I SAM-dependent methyltransferase [Clostridia bacterium]
MLGLDKRLRAVVSQVEGQSLADIGCDHGKVAVACLLQKKVKNAIASDISAPSLQKAKILAQKYCIQNIQFRLSSGFDGYVDGEVDNVVIAGMGAGEIKAILSNIPSGISRFVLVAHADETMLRQFLQQHNFKLISDFVVDCKKHFYHIMTAVDGKETLTTTQLLLGKNDIQNVDYIAYLYYLQKKFSKICAQVSDCVIKKDYFDKLEIVENELKKVKN